MARFKVGGSFAGDMGIVAGQIGPPRIRGQHDAVDQDARQAGEAGREDAAAALAFDLGEDLAAGVVGRQRHRVGIEVVRFAVERDVAAPVHLRPPDEREVDPEGLVAQVFLTVELHQFDQILGRPRIALAAL